MGQKRFALEGAETALVILEELLERAAANNVNEVVIGMAHRGRLNLLANVVGKDVKQIFSEFEGEIDPSSTQGSGDVKYHLGATGTRKMTGGREIVVSVSPNPSHLEAVDPVVEGIVRPKQDRLGDRARERVIPVLIHGDAAFAGQGVVAETLNLSGLDGYTTGGTIHVIINNQIGFTTLPDESRSTPYSTDVARGVQAPIFHVNGDSPQAAVRVVQIAFDYRQKFKKDVVIDMFCYRRHGHNEGDDPSYTQPILYRKIKEHPSVATLYGERLVREGVVTAADVAAMRKGVAARLNEAFDAVQKRAERYELQELSAVAGEEIGNFCPRTAVNHQVLERVVRGMTRFPENFHLHPKLRGFVEKRREALAGNTPGSTPGGKPSAIDWAFAEALAFGTLALEGTAVRLSGQDSGRGTFSQRHLAFYDAETGQTLCSAAAHLARPGAFRRLRQLAQRIRRAGIRIRLQRGRSADPGDLGGAVRRLRQRRADHDRPVHFLLRIEVGPAERPGDAAAARLRRPGAGAFERAHRAVPHAVRREQYAGGQLHHAGAVLPPAAPPDVRRQRPPRRAQAAGDLHAQEPAAPSAGGVDAARFFDRRVHGDTGRAGLDPTCRAWSSARARFITTCWRRARSARPATSRWCAWSSFTRSPPTRRATFWRATRRPRKWCGRRKSRAIWARGGSCANGWSRCSNRRAASCAT